MPIPGSKKLEGVFADEDARRSGGSLRQSSSARRWRSRRLARYHNIFGPEGTWDGGREKAPAALCGKIALSTNGTIEMWGDGLQTRSFVPLIDECVEGATRLLCSNVKVPVNIGSDEMVSINGLAGIIADIAGKKIEINHISGPHGVRGRNSDNALINKLLGWSPSQPLRAGLERSYEWIERQAMRDDD